MGASVLGRPIEAIHFLPPSYAQPRPPAILFGVKERGWLREGYWADLACIDMNAQQLVRREDVLSKCGWSPFDGHTFRSRIDATWVNGHLAWHDGRLDDSRLGMRLEIGRGRE